ncbi:MAG TPA: class I SAM-dependent methyltransferase, partial [Candidatus Aminicenantes bacterium]|nr:class I SAM-dependent methyltransferase [Candidatus Aminicenantes bacterium]
MRIVLPAALRHAVKKALLGAGVRRETIQRVAEFWDGVDTATCPEYWGNFPVVRRATNVRVAGSPDTTWFTRRILEREERFGRVLTFGDGYGMAAEAFQRRHDTDEIVYLNVSGGEGRRFAQRLADVDYRGAQAFVQDDANTMDYLGLGPFDTIIDVGTFHHLFAFERIFPLLQRILKPGGVLYVDEYVGPTRYHFTRPVIDWVN